MSWIALSRTAHQDYRYTPRNGYHHTTRRQAVPVLLAELPKLLPSYVLGFVEGSDGMTPMAVLGLQEGENLYLHPDGRWLGSYVPSALRGYPFGLANTAEATQALAVNEAHLIEVGEGEPLFTDEGELAPTVAATLAFLTQCAETRAVTRQATQTLQDVGLLVPWTLSVTIDDTPRTLGGLYRVDEQAVNRLNPAALARLQGAPMALAYAQLFSMHNSAALVQRARFHEQTRTTATPPADLYGLFGEGDDVDFELDFDQ